MSPSAIHDASRPLKRVLPGWAWRSIRGVATAILAPLLSSYRTGQLRSALVSRSVTRHGEPLPWYTYPCIDFLACRDYSERSVLEFGGGQSTLWWAGRARSVVTLEGDPEWCEWIRSRMSDNVELHLVSMRDRDANVADVEKVLGARPDARYDVVVIDGLYRDQMIDFACCFVTADGIIVCDNAAEFQFHHRFKDRELRRVDFHGSAPGVVLPHTTSIYFGPAAFAFDPAVPIRNREEED
jgi:hypothetical protein